MMPACLPEIVFGQTATQSFSKSDSIIGITYPANYPVTATRYVTPEKIYKWEWDGYSDNLLLELRESNKKGTSFKNSGTLQMVDLGTKKVRWTRKVNYNTSEVRQQGEYYFLSEKKKNQRILSETGDVLWENTNNFYFIDPSQRIGLGYPLQSTSNTLTAVDLSNGRELWRKEIDRTFGWDDAYMLNDSILLISVNGITAIQPANGNGWAYNAKTKRNEIGKMIGVNAAGLFLGMLTGTFVYQNQLDVASGMGSNMLIDPEEHVIFASRDRISRIGNSGTVLWSTPLPEKITSKSSIFMLDSVVYMINRGYALYNGNFSMIGDPYLAAFDLNSGSQLYFTNIPERKEFIRNYQVVNDILFLVFQDKIASYSLSSGIPITEKIAELQKDEYLDAFVESGIYWKRNEQDYTDMVSCFPNNNLIMTTEGRVFVLTDGLETLFVYEKDDIFYKVAENDHFALITSNDTDFVVLGESDNPVAALKASPEMFLNRDRLYFFDRDSFWEIDLDGLRQREQVRRPLL